ncbi:PfkB family carbohydrate kinase [Microbacterium sp. W4I20]|uniref:PfkB family carbohydrate kinase n=1 Tax=Microbacterium sp. W4I20 TaxID=3042262 RepID=UPI00278244B9|nr:PfkB family carbohydrate kinase [Microbacterium sp. W4I20]MDQ0726687.1 fructokinase [Microbacterium sp. W4I20]
MIGAPAEPVDVLVVGEALVDIVEGGGSATEHPGGSPANVALGLGRRGIDVALLTDLGRDPRGSRIARHLERSGVRVLAESFSDRPTSTATATLRDDGSASYLFDVQWNPGAAPLAVSPVVVHTGSIGAFLHPGRATVIAHLDRLGARLVTFDPNIRPALLGTHAETLADFEDMAARAGIVKMSDEDAQWLYPRLSPTEVSDRVRALGPRLVVITRGEGGSMLTAEAAAVSIAASIVPVIDTIGAGDTYMTSLIADVLALSDRDLDRTRLEWLGRRAARAAAITVSRAGADLPWQDELAGAELLSPSKG